MEKTEPDWNRTEKKPKQKKTEPKKNWTEPNRTEISVQFRFWLKDEPF